jgi:hypothetical protein
MIIVTSQQLFFVSLASQSSLKIFNIRKTPDLSTGPEGMHESLFCPKEGYRVNATEYIRPLFLLAFHAPRS